MKRKPNVLTETAYACGCVTVYSVRYDTGWPVAGSHLHTTPRACNGGDNCDRVKVLLADRPEQAPQGVPDELAELRRFVDRARAVVAAAINMYPHARSRELNEALGAMAADAKIEEPGLCPVPGCGPALGYCDDHRCPAESLHLSIQPGYACPECAYRCHSGPGRF